MRYGPSVPTPGDGHGGRFPAFVLTALILLGSLPGCTHGGGGLEQASSDSRNPPARPLVSGRPSVDVRDGQAVDIAELVERFTAPIRAGEARGYRLPSESDMEDMRRGVAALVSGVDVGGDASLALAGYVVRRVTEKTTGRQLALLVDVRSHGARGLYVLAVGRRPWLVVEVPHPVSDMDTDHLGSTIFRDAGASGLFVAGALRSADDGKADVAHEPMSIFEAVQDGLIAAATPPPLIVQVHGFADDSLDGVDAVVSTGSAQSSAPAVAAGHEMAAAGFATCLAWTSKCGALEGFTNVQSQTARAAGADFIHVELGHAVRADGHRLADAGAALVAAVTPAPPK